MSDLGRDARALVARVRKRDGPSAEDRARLRERLDSAWAAHRAGEASALEEVVAIAPASTRGLQPMAAVMLLVSLGFLPPETPRVRVGERLAPVAVSQPSTAAATAATLDNPPLPASDGASEAERVAEIPPDAALGANAAARVAANAAGARRVDRRELAAGSKSAAARLRGHGPVRVAAKREAEAPAPAHPFEAGSAEAASRIEPELDARVRARASSERRRAAASGAEPEADARVRARASSEHRRAAASRREPEPPAAPRERGDAPAGDVAPTVSDRDFKPQAIDDELAWLGAAQDALRKGQPSRALSLVQQHAFRFPRGALAPERSAVQALALCALQRKEAAREVLADLARRTPNSPLLDRVRRKCGL